MKNMKKFFSVLLTLAMVLGMMTTAFAANADVSGHDFTAYQIFKANSIDSTTKELADAQWGSALTEEKQNEILLHYECATLAALLKKVSGYTDDSDEAKAFAKYVLDRVSGDGTPVTSGTTTLPIGYYLVKDTTTANKDVYNVAILKVADSTTPVTVTSKVEVPEIVKKIVEGESKVDYNNGSIGDVVNYEITTKVPESAVEYDYYHFIINDLLSEGLTFNNDIKVYKESVSEDKLLTKDTDYVLYTGDDAEGKTFQIALKDAKSLAGKDIIVTYTATINKDAVIGTAGNPNTVDLTYSNKPDHKYKPVDDDDWNPGSKPGDDEPKGTTPEDKTYTYVTKIRIEKVDGNGNPLTGAEFTITGTKVNHVVVTKDTFAEAEDGEYYKLKNGTYTKTVPHGVQYKEIGTGDENTTEGLILKGGQYVLPEDKSEYVDATLYQKVESNEDAYASTTTKYKATSSKDEIVTSESVKASAYVDEAGYVVFEGLGDGTYKIEETKVPTGYNKANDVNVTIKWTAPTGTSTDCTWEYSPAEMKDGVATITVVNKTGSILPETGGVGTTMFYVIGSLLVVAAGILLISKKRMAVK